MRLLENDRTRSALELALVLVLVEVWLWSSAANGLYRALAGTVIASIILKNLIRQGAGATKIGQPLWSAYRSWIVIIAVTCVLGALILVGAALIYSDGEQLRFERLEKFLVPRVLAGKVFIVVFQQIVLCLFLFPLQRTVFQSRTGAYVATAVTFGVLHLPGLLLVGVTTVAAAIWLYLFERSRRLLPLIVSHFVLVVIAAAVFPERLAYNLAVGRNALPIAHRYERLTEGPIAAQYAQFKSIAYYEANGNADPSFIRALYRDILRRSASEAEVDVWLPILRQNGRAEAVAEFLSSKEYLALRCRHEGICD